VHYLYSLPHKLLWPFNNQVPEKQSMQDPVAGNKNLCRFKIFLSVASPVSYLFICIHYIVNPKKKNFNAPELFY